MQGEDNENIKRGLLADREFIARLRAEVLRPVASGQALAKVVEEVRDAIIELIRAQLQDQLRELVEDNNRILREIQSSLIRPHVAVPNQEEETSFTEVRRLMGEQRQRVQEQLSDASLDRSISAFVELKVQTIQERVMGVDKRLKAMEDKYQTNLNSIWNVLSITQGAIFDHLKETKERRCNAVRPTPVLEEEKKTLLSFLKFGK